MIVPHLSDGHEKLIDQFMQRAQQMISAKCIEEDNHMVWHLAQPELQDLPCKDQDRDCQKQIAQECRLCIVGQQLMETFLVFLRSRVNGNYECSVFGNLKCSVFSNKSTSFSVTMMQQFR